MYVHVCVVGKDVVRGKPYILHFETWLIANTYGTCRPIGYTINLNDAGDAGRFRR